MQQMASDIFVRILRGMGACRKKPAQPASGSQLDDSIGNTPTTVSWRVWGYEVGLGWRLASSGISLPNNVFSWLLSDFTGPFSRPKNPSKTCAPQGASPVVTVFVVHKTPRKQIERKQPCMLNFRCSNATQQFRHCQHFASLHSNLSCPNNTMPLPDF